MWPLIPLREYSPNALENIFNWNYYVSQCKMNWQLKKMKSAIVSIVSLDELEKKSGSLAQKALAVEYFMVRLGARPRAYINSTEVFVVRRHYYAPTFTTQ